MKLVAALLMLACGHVSALRLASRSLKNKQMASSLEVDKDISADDDQQEYEFELDALSKFVPSKELSAAWTDALKKKKHPKQFVKTASNTEGTMSTECAEKIRAWAHSKKADPNNKAMHFDKEWMAEHKECAVPWKGKEMCSEGFEVPFYRLADVVLYKPRDLAEFHQVFFPESIASKFVNRSTSQFRPLHHEVSDNLKILHDIVNGSEYQDFEKPLSTELVVHLRLGNAYKHMLMSDDFYRNKIEELQEKKYDITSVTLVYGDHSLKQTAILDGQSPEDQPQIIAVHKRIGQIENLFLNKNFTVKRRINFNTDCDVVYMANSPLFIGAGGGFSSLIKSLVPTFEGTLL